MKYDLFVKNIWDFYRKNRRSLPWRAPKYTTPSSWGIKHQYEILVSEIMLQQTQVERVVPYFNRFIQELPDFVSLANCPTSKLLTLWKGLGFTRRALNLRSCAQEILLKHNGNIPSDKKALESLSGIGPYTAGALISFVHNKSAVLIETNIRTVYIHHYFKRQTSVSDTEILKKIEKTLQKDSPREWYYALMDYGAMIKKKYGNSNKKSKHYSKQSRFSGSTRQLRSHLLDRIMKNSKYAKEELIEAGKNIQPTRKKSEIEEIIKILEKEKFIYSENNFYFIL